MLSSARLQAWGLSGSCVPQPGAGFGSLALGRGQELPVLGASGCLASWCLPVRAAPVRGGCPCPGAAPELQTALLIPCWHWEPAAALRLTVTPPSTRAQQVPGSAGSDSNGRTGSGSDDCTGSRQGLVGLWRCQIPAAMGALDPAGITRIPPGTGCPPETWALINYSA